MYGFLENPKIYNLIERILSFGKSDENIRQCLKKYIDAKEGDGVLDVGCGTGRYATLFPNQYVGVDINENYIKYAKSRYGDDFITMDATRLDFPDEKFKYIFSVGVLHHLSDNQAARAINEMKRVCQKGGSIFIIDAVYPSRLNLFGYMLFYFDRGRYRRTLNELNALLSKNSFHLIQDHINGDFPYMLCVFKYN